MSKQEDPVMSDKQTLEQIIKQQAATIQNLTDEIKLLREQVKLSNLLCK